MGREVRYFDYVNHPYEAVREALVADPMGVLQRATSSASERAGTVTAGLRVDVAGIEMRKEIDLDVRTVEPQPGEASATPATRLAIEWRASQSPRLFPVMTGELAIYPLTATETQIDFEGRYAPPLGPLGKAVNALALSRVAEASVHQFVRDVAAYLRATLDQAR